jgi:uncharacterized protein YbjT (DUF2867 family)
MRLLILGGTQFLGRAIAAHAYSIGHDVTCAARGVAGTVPYRARFIRVDRDEPDGLAPLAGKEFDAVVDVSRHPRVDGLVSASGIESTGCRQHIQRPRGPEEANDRELFRHARSAFP